MVIRTNEALWERIKEEITAEEVAGTRSGEWSARKAQLAVQRYKKAGGGYKGSKRRDNSLVKWTEQEWTTKSGMPSSLTGERYLPKEAIEALSDIEYRLTTRAKRRDTKAGKQFSKQPIDIAAKVAQYRD